MMYIAWRGVLVFQSSSISRRVAAPALFFTPVIDLIPVIRIVSLAWRSSSIFAIQDF